MVLVRVISKHPPLNTEFSLMSSPTYVEPIRSIDKSTNKVTNNPARKPSYSSTNLVPPPFPSRPGTMVAIEHHSEGVQMANNHRSMSSNMQRPAMTAY